MKVTFDQDVQVVDMVTNRTTTLPVGTREMRRVSNPFPRDFPGPEAEWLVVPGTRVGAAVGYLRLAMKNGNADL